MKKILNVTRNVPFANANALAKMFERFKINVMAFFF